MLGQLLINIFVAFGLCFSPLEFCLAALWSPGPTSAQHFQGQVSSAKKGGRPGRARRTKKRKKRPRCRTGASKRYRRMVKRWRKVPRIPKPRYRAGYRDLTIWGVNCRERIRVFPFLADGSLNPEALEEFERVFQDRDSGATHPIHPRLVKLLYKLADHFNARQITLISGFRDADQSERESKHTKGQAADFVLTGVSVKALARQARRLGHVGVGYYPVSGFIHLDVRDGPSYFWVDRSGPGKPACHKRMMRKSGWKFDSRWRPAGDEPEQQRNKKGELKGGDYPAQPGETGGAVE